MPSEESRAPARQLHMRIPLDVYDALEALRKDQHRTMTTEVTLALKFYVRTHRRRLERIGVDVAGS